MNNTFKTTYYSVQTPKQIHDLRIVFVSDLHLKEYGKDNEDLLVAIKNLKPDIIAVGGDSVIYNNKDFSSAITFLNNAA
jgi:predicted MPP superfamily phosphohydrolase